MNRLQNCLETSVNLNCDEFQGISYLKFVTVAKITVYLTVGSQLSLTKHPLHRISLSPLAGELLLVIPFAKYCGIKRR